MNISTEQAQKLAQAVFSMRYYQKLYFSSRDWLLLNDAKKAEAQVDAILREIFPKGCPEAPHHEDGNHKD